MPSSLLRIVVAVLFFSSIASTGFSQEASAATKAHPLGQVLTYARKQHALVKRDIRDYECLIVKAERIDGSMQTHQYMSAKVRAGHTGKPFAVHVTFLKPSRVKGRVVEYVAGEYDGQLLVRRRKG